MKTNLILALSILAIASTSCRKERTCECKTTSTEVITGFGAQTNTYTSSDKVVMEKQKKSQFKYSNQCFSTRTTDNDSGGNGATAWSSQTTNETICEVK
ncbi:hypothetical protein CNR22_08165 [Sphingobacteriaceae bacterium]|nr:hypothetical protein CNR22_08165 [Sphingobacteriaceae bacterium]